MGIHIKMAHTRRCSIKLVICEVLSLLRLAKLTNGVRGLSNSWDYSDRNVRDLVQKSMLLFSFDVHNL